MKEFIKKGNYLKQKILIAIIITILISATLVMITPIKIWDRFPIFFSIILFALLHLILPLKEMYEFIYKKRYLLALIIFAYIVIMGYSGSSIGCYNTAFQPSHNNKYYSPILGIARPIRSDEWNVNTPIAVSQAVDPNNKFGYFNDNLRGTLTEMFSVAASPVADILVLAKPFFIGFLIFGAEHGQAFLWYGKVIALMLISFELCMLISNKKKLTSLLGMILIVFSAATQWWNITDFVIWGGLALILFDKFLTTNKYKVKWLCALGIFISAISYVFILYPAWQLTYGYAFIPVFIWIIWKNRKIYKMNLKDALIILLVILAIAGIGLRYYMLSKDVLKAVSSTDYPGERFEIGNGGKTPLFSYVYSMFFPYEKNISNPCEASGMLSIFPIPIIISIIFLIRSKERKKHFAFLIPALLISSLFSVWCLMATNELLAKITFLYMVPGARLAIPLGFLQILLIIYIMGNIKEEDKIINNKSIVKVVSVILSLIILSIAINSDIENVMGNLKSYICGIILLAEIYLLFTINKEKSRNLLIALLIPVALITGIAVNPIHKGISVLTDKPVAKKIQEIVKNDPENNMWLAESLPNYFLASGAKVINSVNTYPNFELYEKILGDKARQEEYRKIYNRYAHIYLQVIEGESTIQLVQADAITLKINAEAIKQIGVKYIVGMTPLEKFSNNQIEFEKIYDEEGMLIYKVNY